MLEIARGGELVAAVSRRGQWTALGGSFALSVTNTRPVEVAAHIVPVFCGARAIHATAPVARVPHAALFSCVEGTPSPMITKSPQPGCAAGVATSGQFASR